MVGIFHLATNPALLKPIMPSLLKGTAVSVAIVIAMFIFTYLPQVAVLAFVSGPLAFIAAVPLVLGEAYVIVNFVTRTFIFDQIGTDLFDAVLVQKRCNALVEKGRKVTVTKGRASQLGKVITKPLGRFSLDNAVRYVLTLPLNFIPVVGTAFFLGLNGYKSGPSCHSRYFELKGYDKARRQAEIQQRRGSYTAFGIVSLLLNLIPVVSIFFTCSTAVGAALWAAELETASGAVTKGADNDVQF